LAMGKIEWSVDPARAEGDAMAKMIKVGFGDEEVRNQWFTVSMIVVGVLLLLAVLVIAPFYWSHHRSERVKHRRFELVELVGRDPVADAEAAIASGEPRFLIVGDEVPGIDEFQERFGDRYQTQLVPGIVRNPVNETIRRLNKRVRVYAAAHNQHLLRKLEDAPDPEQPKP